MGSLLRGPRHGYEIRVSVEGSMGGLVHLTNSQIYPALKRFEEQGAVRREVVPQEGRPDRHQYALTAHGRGVLRDLVADISGDGVRRESEFYVRVAFFGMLSPPQRLAVLRQRRAVLVQRRENVAGWGARDGEPPRGYLGELGQLRAETFDLELRWIDRWIARVLTEDPHLAEQGE